MSEIWPDIYKLEKKCKNSRIIIKQNVNRDYLGTEYRNVNHGKWN